MNKGFSLIEILVYVAILGVVSVIVSNSLIQIGTTYQRVRIERETLAGARTALEAIADAARQSREIYTPTSRFDTDTGQLSLITPVDAQPEHTTSYVDFWIDNGVLFVRREGKGTAALSAPSIRVTKLRLQRVVQTIDRQQVRISVEADSVSARFPTAVTLTATAALRGNY